MTTAKYDVSGATRVFAIAQHRREPETYAAEQIAAARALCLTVLEAAASRGFSVDPEAGDRTWRVSASQARGSAHVAITSRGDIQVSTRQLETPRPLAIRYDPLAKAFVSTEERQPCVATALAEAIVAALDEGWERATRAAT